MWCIRPVEHVDEVSVGNRVIVYATEFVSRAMGHNHQSGAAVMQSFGHLQELLHSHDHSLKKVNQGSALLIMQPVFWVHYVCEN